jgi:hypothetical protein
MTALRSSRLEIQSVRSLVERWCALGPEMTARMTGDVADDAAVRRWVAAIGRLQVGAFMRLANAVWHVARNGGRAAPSAAVVRSLHRRMLRSAFRDPIDLASLVVDGDDLRRAGIPPGPGLGKILQALLAAVIDDPARNTADWLLQEALRLQHGR